MVNTVTHRVPDFPKSVVVLAEKCLNESDYELTVDRLNKGKSFCTAIWRTDILGIKLILTKSWYAVTQLHFDDFLLENETKTWSIAFRFIVMNWNDDRNKYTSFNNRLGRFENVHANNIEAFKSDYAMIKLSL